VNCKKFVKNECAKMWYNQFLYRGLQKEKELKWGREKQKKQQKPQR